MQYTLEELLRRGYPPRPDPVAHPGMYSMWLQAASRSAEVVDSKNDKVPASKLEFGALTKTTLSTWAGMAMTDAPYIVAVTRFNVPYLRMYPSGNVVGASPAGASALWVGLGGLIRDPPLH